MYIEPTTLLLLTGLALASAVAWRWWLLPRLSHGLLESPRDRLGPRLGVPVAFGAGSTWLAIRGVPKERVADALGLHQRQACGWPEGIDSAHEKKVFITPAVKGWTLVVGRELCFGDEGAALIALSRRISAEVQLFTVDVEQARFAWGRARAGQLLRAFEWDAGDVVIDHGEALDSERECGVWPVTEEGPDPRRIFDLAGVWSLDPQSLSRIDSDLGFGVSADGHGTRLLGLPTGSV